MPIRLEQPTLAAAESFLAAVRRSRSLHQPWAYPPSTHGEYEAYVERLDDAGYIGHFVRTEDGALAGVVNINEIVRGSFQSGYLGYYALSPHDGQGYMCEALAAVVERAFREYGLHRLEANIQPGNARSVALARKLGFRREGFSPKYLKIGGQWRDHERWAITAEDTD